MGDETVRPFLRLSPKGTSGTAPESGQKDGTCVFEARGTKGRVSFTVFFFYSNILSDGFYHTS